MNILKGWIFGLVFGVSSIAPAWSADAPPKVDDGSALTPIVLKAERYKEYEVLTPKMTDEVFNAYKAKAEQGDPVAIDIVYFALKRGCGRKIDQLQAEPWREKGLKAGGLAVYVMEGARSYSYGKEYIKHAEQAMKQLGSGAGPMLLYLNALCLWNAGDTKVGLERMTLAANQGNAWAQTFLGTAYVKVNGPRLPRNFALAKGWLEKAVAQGSPAAMYQLGEMYKNGWGVAMDGPKYGKLLEQAAALGEPEAVWMFSYVQGEQGFELRLKAAEAGSHQAAHSMVSSYMMGSGVKKDEAEAFKWSVRLMDDGCSTGYRNVGVGYLKGCGTTVDFSKGIETLTKGLHSRYDINCAVQCMLLLSDGYATSGKNNDPAKAKEWKDKAFEQKEHIAEALFDLGQSFGKGWGVRKSAEEAVKWYSLGSELKHPGCQFKLARCYEFGWAVGKDPAKAQELYDQAEKGGWQRGGKPIEKPVIREVVGEEF